MFENHFFVFFNIEQLSGIFKKFFYQVFHINLSIRDFMLIIHINNYEHSFIEELKYVLFNIMLYMNVMEPLVPRT